MKNWTQDQLELAERLWGENRKAAEIAELLGPEFTKNAIIGMANRRGWWRIGSPKPKPPKPEHKPITLMKLTPHTCRWPMTGATGAATLFCGKMIANNSSYCPDHAQKARGHHK